MEIGRKIYYELATGNVIINTGERQGDVVETSTEKDFQDYTALSKYTSEEVGIISLPYGQDVDKFGVYNYHVDLSSEQIIWDSAITYDVVEELTLEQRMHIAVANNTITAAQYKEITGEDYIA